jgi:hypothetical protein
VKVFYRKSTVFISIFIFILIPFLSYAQRSREDNIQSEKYSVEQAFIDGRNDAKEETSGLMWFGCGLVPVFGLGASFLFVSGPPQERLLGKPSEYVYAYTKQYKRAKRSKQTRSAMLGCAVSGTILLITSIILLSQEDTECCSGPDLSCGLDDECGNISGCAENSSSCSSSSTSCGGSAE